MVRSAPFRWRLLMQLGTILLMAPFLIIAHGAFAPAGKMPLGHSKQSTAAVRTHLPILRQRGWANVINPPSPAFVSDQSLGALNLPVIVPVFSGGPSNQIYQAKLVAWAMQNDTTGAILLLPPISPHFTQRRAAQNAVPFSSFFAIMQKSAFPQVPLIVEEEALWRGTAPMAVRLAATKSINESCTVFVGSETGKARCDRYVKIWATRVGGRACGGGFIWSLHSGNLRSLAADLAATAKRTGSPSGLVLACSKSLEGYLHPSILFNAKELPPGGYADGDYPQRPGKSLTGPAAISWIETANILKFRGADGVDDNAELRTGGSAQLVQALKKSSFPSTLALQLRVPDYVVLETNRPKHPKKYCVASLHRSQVVAEGPPLGSAFNTKCSYLHLLLSRDTLFNFIVDAIEGNENPTVSGNTLAPVRAALSGSELLINHVHLLTNDDLLAADLAEFLTDRGLKTTFSADRSIPSLMQDYNIAIGAAVFWGTKTSTITANIVHARLAAGQETKTTLLWEDIVIPYDV
jgi:hypothetical protein